MTNADSYAANWNLASQNIIPDVPAMRKRAQPHVNFTKIVNPASIVKAGITDFNGVFGVRLVDDGEYVKFIHSHIKK
jgi:hypothetical protein